MYVKINDDGIEKFPYTIRNLRKDNMNTSFPKNIDISTLNKFGVFDVIITKPDITEHQRLITPAMPILVDGSWNLILEVVDFSIEEITAYETTKAERLQKSITDSVQKRLDDYAISIGYDSIISVCSYSTSSIPRFQTEGQYCLEKRDETWAFLDAYLTDVLAGNTEAPTSYADVEALLPELSI